MKTKKLRKKKLKRFKKDTMDMVLGTKKLRDMT